MAVATLSPAEGCGEASMTLRTEQCTIRLVSDMGRRLVEAADDVALIDFTRKTLACPRLRVCPHGD